MKKFVKNPVIIEAIQFDNTPENIEEIKNLGTPQCSIRYINNSSNSYITITTLEGIMRADIGDYIIKGVKGELYPCKPDIFALTYKCADNFLDRLYIEMTELNDKIDKLTKFIDSENFHNLSENMQNMLKLQLTIMTSYSSVLNMRYSVQN